MQKEAFDTIQHFMIQRKIGIEENYPNIIKSMHEKSIVNIIPNSEILKALFLRSGTRQGFLSPPLFNIVLDVLNSNWARKK